MQKRNQKVSGRIRDLRIKKKAKESLKNDLFILFMLIEESKALNIQYSMALFLKKTKSEIHDII